MKNLCRCGHVRPMHTTWAYTVEVQLGSCTGYVIDSVCECEKFIPKDNLEYLEWRYDGNTTR